MFAAVSERVAEDREPDERLLGAVLDRHEGRRAATRPAAKHERRAPDVQPCAGP